MLNIKTLFNVTYLDEAMLAYTTLEFGIQLCNLYLREKY
jgi:hypothetical protein